MTTNCRLCGLPKALVQSHVVPELLFRRVYDADSRCWLLEGETGRQQRIQKGYRERLLCQDCEGILQKEERYFSQLWHHLDPLPQVVEGAYIVRSNFSFESFFRFHLSILWRASVARGAMFSAVRLGPFEEPLRQYLVGLTSTLPYEPSIYGMILRRPGAHELWNRMIAGPTTTRIKGIRAYNFVFGGCSWFYFVSKKSTPLPVSLRLTRPGVLTMPVIDYTSDATISRALRAWAHSRSGRTFFDG